MAATIKYDAVAKLPEGKNGKRHTLKVGVVFQTDKGLSLKLEALPVGFDGWISFYEPRPKGERAAAAPSAAPFDDGDSPF